MNKWIAVTFFTVLACNLGIALECYKCDFGTCTFPSKATCGALEVCLTETAKTGPISMKQKSCSAPTNCMGESQKTYAGVTVTTTPACCTSDLCNSAAIPSASFLSVIAIFVSIWVARLWGNSSKACEANLRATAFAHSYNVLFASLLSALVTYSQ